MVINELIRQIKDILRKGSVPDFDFDGNCIAEDILKMDRTSLLLNGDKEADGIAAKKAVEAAEKRCEGYPLQYILGSWEFYGLPMTVGEGVLIPRSDTETVVYTVLEYYKKEGRNLRILDLCSGSGCIAIALKKNIPGAEVTAIENSEDALPYLVKNARLNEADIRIIRGDIFSGAVMDNFSDKEDEGEYIKFGCIVSNPPYLTDKEMSELQKEVTFEPEYALSGGYDGLKFYRVITLLWSEVLEKDGLMALEAGSEQCGAVAGMLEQCGFYDIDIIKDGAGNDRVIAGKKK